MVFNIGIVIGTTESGTDISCVHCHSNEVKEFEKGVHYNKISCVDCHGGDSTINGSIISIDVMNKDFTGIPAKTNTNNSKMLSKNSKMLSTEFCSKCHNDVTKLYKDSVHWNGIIKGRENSASCLDCHGVHSILSYRDPNSTTYYENVPLLCNCHENQTKMQAWYYGIETDRFDTYKKSYHYRAMMLGGGKERSLATCPDCHENHNTKNESDPSSAIYPANLVKTCEKSGCHSEQKALIYGGKVHEGQSVYLLSTNIDLKTLVTYLYIIMIIFELCFTLGLIFLGIYSSIDIIRRH